MGGAAGLGASGMSGAAAKGGAGGMPPMGGGMGGGGDAISSGIKGLTSLFGGLMDDAKKRRLAEAQGMADAAGTEGQGMAQGAVGHAGREADAFGAMMGAYGKAMV